MNFQRISMLNHVKIQKDKTKKTIMSDIRRQRRGVVDKAEPHSEQPWMRTDLLTQEEM